MMHQTKRMRLKPPPGKKLVRDWNGVHVEILRPMQNGWCDIPAGTKCIVDGVGGGGTGLHLKTNPCTCCGVAVSISRISHEDVKVIE